MNELEKALELKKQIEMYDYQYYELGKSDISDAEYDRMYKEYSDLEQKYPELKSMADSPTARVGAGSKATTSTTLPKFTHKSPLLSIDQKAKDIDSLRRFYEKIEGRQVIVEPKLDGITVNVNYEHGHLVNAATRGNGYIGDLITDNFLMTDTKFPMDIDTDVLEVRGEAIIPYSSFEADMMDDYSNPRNAVSGIMRMIDPKEVKGKHIEVMFYDVGTQSFNKGDILKDAQYVDTLKKWGFQSVPTVICNTYEELEKCIMSKMNGMIIEKNGFNVLNVDGYPDAVCDGLVIKVNDLHDRLEIGMSQKGPLWAFAFKFKPLQAETVINDVLWQVGKSGRVSPVAIFDNISLGGTNITRATLNNYDYMCSLPYKDPESLETTDIRKGDTIIVERSNDVIPRIVAVKEHNGGSSFLPPDVCPECGSKLVKEGPLHFCKNGHCPARVVGLLEHYASRNAMNIVGLGESIVEALHEKGYVKEFADIYDLTKDKLYTLESFKDKKVNKLLEAIEKSKEPELANFIYALSIPNVGRKTAKDLAVRYQNMDNLMACKKEELLEMEDMGDIMADGIVGWFTDVANKAQLDRLLEKVSPKQAQAKGDRFKGMTFVITGTLANSRDYYQKIIEDNGGKVSGSVSKKTHVVLIGDNAGSKETKARELIAKGAPILILDSEEKIMNYLEKTE